MESFDIILRMIKAELSLKVKALCLMLGLALFASSAVAQVKEIDAEEFKVTLLKKSTSGRVLLLQDSEENIPYPGKILLLKEGSKETAAVRVLKNYSGKFAAITLFKFSDAKIGSEYRALKKIGDKMMEMIKEREKRLDNPDRNKTDEELSDEVAPDDAELDRGIPGPVVKPPAPKLAPKKPPVTDESLDAPTPSVDETSEQQTKPPEPVEKKVTQRKAVEPLFNPEGEELDSAPSESVEGDEDFFSPTIEPFVPIDPFNNTLSLQYGSILNYDAQNKAAHYGAVGLRYAYALTRSLAFQKRHIQDALSFEASLFYYGINGYVVPGDSVSILPIEGALRYSMLFHEYFSVFVYAGVLRNTVFGSSIPNGSTADFSRLTNTLGALGFGATMRFGPSWELRFDYGIEMTAIGVSLKF